nr:uroporphyrinogen-III synthase [Hoeflea prorocentri]
MVTRPEPGASSTAERLRNLGYEPVLMPLTRIVDMPADLSELADAPAFAATSASAIRSWRARGIEAEYLHRPFYAVGERTAAVARDCGFEIVSAGGGDGADLGRLVDDDVRSGKLRLSEQAPLIYLAGAVRHGGFESQLLERNIPHRTVEIYKIGKISYSTDYILEALSTGGQSAVLLYSRVAADCFFRLIDTSANYNNLKNISFLCMSDNVLDAVPENVRPKAIVSAAPDEKSLLALLGGSDKMF